MQISKFFISLFLLGIVCLTASKITPPAYSQHDSRWGKKQLGTGRTTISQLGCLLSTMASMIAHKGIKVSGQTATPLTMNTYFKSKRMFSGDILFYKAPTLLGFTFEGIVTSRTTIMNAVKAGKYAHLHVLRGTHWVLVTELVSGGYNVMDPGSGKTRTYKYNDVVGCAIYSYSKNRNLAEEEPVNVNVDVDVDVDTDSDSGYEESDYQSDSESN